MDGRAPVVVGVGMVDQRHDDPSFAAEPLELMLQAVQRAGDDSGVAALLSRVELIASPRGLWQYGDPGRHIADAIGSPAATTVLSLVGVLQQTLIGDACRRIAEGEIDVAAVVGGEARFRKLRGRILDVEVVESDIEGTPDVTLKPTADLVLQSEIHSGLGPMPVGYYAIIESALRAAAGLSIDEHRRRVADLYSRFSAIAVGNPHAWKREPVAAEFIREPSDKNPMLAFPYTKLHNSSWNVDQATALLICSAAAADEVGIDPSRRVFARASAESNHATTISARPDLARCPGVRLAGRSALAAAAVDAHAVDLVELYSCFPAAVQMHARELGVRADVDWTVTGGMPFAGGPFNSYVLQSTGTMIERLRAQPGAVGLVSSVSGLLTKQGVGLWSTEPGANRFASVDVTDAVAAEEQPRAVVTDASGDGTVVGYTVMHKDAAPRGVVLVDLADGSRCMTGTDDPDTIKSMESEEWVGRGVKLAAGQFA